MSNCGYNEGDLTGSPVSFGGSQIAPGHPYPVVKIKENIDGAKCGFGGQKSVSISIQGELVCCDPVEKMNASESLNSKFSEHCGNFSAGGYSYENCRVESFDLSQSNFRNNVAYSASLIWFDPDYPSGDAGKVRDVTDSIQSSENDDTVTVTHTVSAFAKESQDCDSCGCDTSDVRSFVESRISSSCPTPQIINIPNNKNATGHDCPEVTEEQDDESCFISITKVWTINKNLDLLPSGYSKNIKVTSCTESQYDRNQKETITISGSINWEASVACQEDCNSALSEVLSALSSEVSKAIASNSGKKANVQKGWSDAFPPSANYTVTFPPEPDDIEEKYKDNYSISVSFGSDGVGTVNVGGTLSANGQALKTISENCLCEVVDANFSGEGKYRGEATKYYGMIKGIMANAIAKIQGPCAKDNPLRLENSDVEKCEAGSKKYSYDYTDKEEKDAQWNYSVNVSKPLEQVSIQNTLGGGYCVTRTDSYNDGSVSVNGSRSQNCPGDPDFNVDGLALDLAKAATGAQDLKTQGNCTETVNGDKEKNTFSKSFTYENDQAGASNIGSVQVLNNQNNKKKF